MRFVKTALIWVVVIGLGYLAFHFIWPLLAPEEVETDILTAKVQRGDLRKVVPADGVVEPSVLVEVQSKASGVVEAIHVEPGDEVETGDILVELDKEQLEANKRQAEASLAQAQASLRRTQRNTTRQSISSRESQIRQHEISLAEAQDSFDRIAELYGKGYATEEEYQSAKTKLDSAQETLEQAREQLALEQEGGEEEDIEAAQASVDMRQAELDDVLEELANTTVRAPLSGTVLTRPVEMGSAVRSGTSGNSEGTVVATIGDLSTMYVRANIEETDLGNVQLGSPCRITFDAYVGWLWNGTVTKIYPQGEEQQSGTQFQIDIEIDQEHAQQESAGGRSGGGGRNGGGMRGGGGPPSGGGGAPPGGSAPPGGGASPAGGSPAAGSESAAEGAAPTGTPAAGGKPAAPLTPQLFPKMTANVEIVLEDHSGVMILAAKYVQYDETGQKYVEILPDPENTDKRERHDIETGFTDGMRFEIVSGVEEGDTVVLEREIEEEAGRPF
ncbi:HlyD family secretion protein [bacterium]|nr:HlyD family secretion protein [bacterium]